MNDETPPWWLPIFSLLALLWVLRHLLRLIYGG